MICINTKDELSLYNLEGKGIDSNWFWIHHIDEKEKSPKLLDPSEKTEFKEI